MADTLAPSERSALMASVRSRGNRSTELQMIRVFRRLSICGWRRGSRLFGHPDFVFPCKRVLVFVDGCFWHGCPIHGRLPKTRRIFWNSKIVANKVRDLTITRRLRREGWRVIRIWEHELRPRAAETLRRRLVRLRLATSAALDICHRKNRP